MRDIRGVTPEIAAHVLYEADYPGGCRAGSFVSSLIEAIVYADDSNKALLSMAFPGYVRAVRALQHREDGVATLQRIAADGRQS